MVHAPPLPKQPHRPSAFFQESLQRLEVFDLETSERSKELLIDAVCAEVMQKHQRLKVWKAAALESDELIGTSDYLIAPSRAYLEAPLLCVVEAKLDDFRQGLAQCLVVMQACQWNNEQLGQKIDVFGVVTNGDLWRFYKLTTQGQVYKSIPSLLVEAEKVLETFHAVLTQCEAQLK